MVNHEPAGVAGSPAPTPASSGRILLQIAELGGALQMHTALAGGDALALLLAAAVKLGDDLGQPFRVEPVERTSAGGIVLPGPGAVAPGSPVKRPQ